mmetsp:Transcript_66491/g.144391  ORF Transcript_66491/g.144391 Transcript_66491/m.144391 type:complete len:99 (-) Transcript_66491:80-376(-)
MLGLLMQPCATLPLHDHGKSFTEQGIATTTTTPTTCSPWKRGATVTSTLTGMAACTALSEAIRTTICTGAYKAAAATAVCSFCLSMATGLSLPLPSGG